MKTTMAGILAAILALAWPAPAAADCDAYKERAKRASRDLKQFERYVLDPLKERRGMLEEELRREVEGPERLARKIAGLRDQARDAEKKKRNIEGSLPAREKKAASLAARLADLEDQIDDANAAGEKKRAKKLQKERKKAAESYKDVRRKIRRDRARLEELAEEAVEREEKIQHLRSRRERILTTPPPPPNWKPALRKCGRICGTKRDCEKRRSGRQDSSRAHSRYAGTTGNSGNITTPTRKRCAGSVRTAVLPLRGEGKVKHGP